MDYLRCRFGMKADVLTYGEHLERRGPRTGLCVISIRKKANTVWSEMMKKNQTDAA